MKDILTMIMAGGTGERLFPLTLHRAKPAVTFGGAYRLIDFTLSNCINSGLRKIVVLTQYKSLSLDRHLRLTWNILNADLDEYIFSIPPQMRVNSDWYKGTADSIYQNLYYANMVNPRYFLILSADHVYKMDYSGMIDFHKEKGADATVATIEVDRREGSQYGIMKVDANDRIIAFKEKPKKFQPPMNGNKTILANMGVYIFNSRILRKFLEEDARKDSNHDFGKNIIPAMIQGAKVFSYNFRDKDTGNPKYWRDVGTSDAYYEANMDLVEPNPEFNLYDRNWPIRNHQCQYPPAKVVFSQGCKRGSPALCLDSLVSGGCIINGKVQKSILSAGVKINSNARVEESLLMEGVEVGDNCKIKRAIIDKRVKVPSGIEIGYDLEEDKKKFFVTDSGIVVIPKNEEILPPGAGVSRRERIIEYGYSSNLADFQ